MTEKTKSKKYMVAATTQFTRQLSNWHDGYFNHSVVLSEENKSFCRTFEPKTDISVITSLYMTAQRASSSTLVLENATQPGSTEALQRSSALLQETVKKLQAAVSQEPKHIARRKKTRELKEVEQDKEMKLFYESITKTTSEIYADYEQKAELLRQKYSDTPSKTVTQEPVTTAESKETTEKAETTETNDSKDTIPESSEKTETTSS